MFSNFRSSRTIASAPSSAAHAKAVNLSGSSGLRQFGSLQPHETSSITFFGIVSLISDATAPYKARPVARLPGGVGGIEGDSATGLGGTLPQSEPGVRLTFRWRSMCSFQCLSRVPSIPRFDHARVVDDNRKAAWLAQLIQVYRRRYL